MLPLERRSTAPVPAAVLQAAFAGPRPSMPSGWYFAVASAALRAGGSVVVRMAGRDVLVFRTASGRVRATWNVCPHLGARLGDGGRVVGEAFECPLHHRRYVVSDGARDIGEGEHAIEGIFVREQNGLVLAWIASDGDAPRFVVPAVDDAGWTPPVFATLGELPTSAEIVMQDLADTAHFRTVHRYRDVGAVEPFTVEGPSLRVAYAVTRGLGPRSLGYAQAVRFWSRVHGLGYQLTEVAAFGGAVRTRHFVLPVPVDTGVTRITLGLSVRLDGAGAAMGHAARLLVAPVMRSFLHDVGLDARAWVGRYPVAGLLHHAEPELRAFQAWATQFYPPAS